MCVLLYWWYILLQNFLNFRLIILCSYRERERVFLPFCKHKTLPIIESRLHSWKLYEYC